MADEADINQVLVNIPDEYEQYGWDQDKIEDMLDANLTPTAVTVSFYKGMVARTSQIVSVSESGSSRSLGDIYRNAMDLLKYWQGELDKEQNPETPTNRSFPVSRKITRV